MKLINKILATTAVIAVLIVIASFSEVEIINKIIAFPANLIISVIPPLKNIYPYGVDNNGFDAGSFIAILITWLIIIFILELLMGRKKGGKDKNAK